MKLKTVMVVLMLVIPASLFAVQPDCNLRPDFPACKASPQGLTGNEVASVSEPGALSLVGLGLAAIGLVKLRKRMK